MDIKMLILDYSINLIFNFLNMYILPLKMILIIK